jgi:hypothetical protein
VKGCKHSSSYAMKLNDEETSLLIKTRLETEVEKEEEGKQRREKE